LHDALPISRFLMDVVDRARLEAVVDREVEGIGLPQRIEREGLPLDHRWTIDLPVPPRELDLQTLRGPTSERVAADDVRLNDEDSSTVEVSARTATRAVGLVERHELVDESDLRVAVIVLEQFDRVDGSESEQGLTRPD